MYTTNEFTKSLLFELFDQEAPPIDSNGVGLSKGALLFLKHRVTSEPVCPWGGEYLMILYMIFPRCIKKDAHTWQLYKFGWTGWELITAGNIVVEYVRWFFYTLCKASNLCTFHIEDSCCGLFYREAPARDSSATALPWGAILEPNSHQNLEMCAPQRISISLQHRKSA